MTTQAADSGGTTRFFSAEPKTYINIIIMLAIEVFFRWIPAFGEMTQDGMAVLGVFLGTIYGWLTLNMGIVGLVGIVMMGTTMMYAGTEQAILAAFGNPNTLRILTCFGVAGIMEHSGGSSYLAKKIVGMKIGRKSSLVFIFLFMIAAIAVGPFVGFATPLLLWGMWKQVCETLKAPKAFLRYGITCIIIAFNLANQCFPFIPMMVTLNGVWTASTGLPPAPFINYVSYMLLLSVFVCILWVLLGKYILRVQLVDCSNMQIPAEKATPYVKYVLWSVVLYVILLCFASIDLGAISAYLNTWGLLGFSTLFVLVTLLLQPKGAQKTYHENMGQSVKWDLIATMGVIMLLSGTLSSNDVGLGATLVSSLSFLTLLKPVAFILLILAIPLILTQYLNNMAIAVIFIPIFFTFGSELGLNVYALNTSLYILNGVALASPAGSLPSAMYYANEDIDRKTGYYYGWIFTVMVYVAVVLFYVLLSDVFFPPKLIS